MISNLSDLHAAITWMHRAGYTKADPETWPLLVNFRGFEIVRTESSPWIVWSRPPPPEHRLLSTEDLRVAPRVVELIQEEAKAEK